MHALLKQRVIELSKASVLETCGFFYRDHAGRAQLHECRNVSANPVAEFEISSDDYVTALNLGTILGIYHSHPAAGQGPTSFSEADLECAEEQALPFYLYDAAGREWHEYLPASYRPELISRPFCLGFGGDCYGLVRDYFRNRHRRYLSDYDRDESFLHEEQGVIMANFRREGFVLGSLKTLQPADILMFRTDKALPQHFGIYLGDQRLLHHPLNALSREELLSGRWLSRLDCVFRSETPLVSV